MISVDTKHNRTTKTALPYVTYDSPIGDSVAFEAGSQNILTTIKGYAEKRPGFTKMGTTIGGVIKRLFTWQMWDGSFFIMASAIVGGNSNVYKMKVGTDSGFSLVYSDVGNSVPFDFVVTNNKLFFANGHELWYYAGVGTTVHPAGIGLAYTPDHKPTAALVAVPDALTAINGGYQYCYAWGSSVTGSLSGPSMPSVATGNFSMQRVDITFPKTSDSQVNEVHLYRTTDGGGGVYFECENSPYAYTPGVGTVTVSDTTPDTDLSSVRAPVAGINISWDIIALPKGLTWYANRVWGFRNNTLYWTGWEEVENGVEEECWCEDNQWPFPTQITGLTSIQSALLVFTACGVWAIAGDSQDTFHRELIFTNIGTRTSANITTQGKMVAWFDTSQTVHATNGVSEDEVSVSIRPDVESVDPTASSITFHKAKKRNWLVLSGAGKLFVHDLDTTQWMPPWTVNATALHSGETAIGVVDLLVAVGGDVWKLDPSVYTDNGTLYNEIIITSLMEIVPPGSPEIAGDLEYVGIERKGAAPSNILQLVDEDPDGATFTSILTNKTDPSWRTQGVNLLEEWYWSRTPAARRVAMKFIWAASASPFFFYGIDFAYKPAAL